MGVTSKRAGKSAVGLCLAACVDGDASAQWRLMLYSDEASLPLRRPIIHELCCLDGAFSVGTTLG